MFMAYYILLNPRYVLSVLKRNISVPIKTYVLGAYWTCLTEQNICSGCLKTRPAHISLKDPSRITLRCVRWVFTAPRAFFLFFFYLLMDTN